MKKLIAVLGIIFLTIIVILNIIYTTDMTASEQITINFNSVLYVVGLIAVGVILFYITYFANKHLFNDTETKNKHKLRVVLFIISIILYIVFAVVFNIFVRPYVVGDSVHVCNLAQTFYRGEDELLTHDTYLGITLFEYMQAYPQQISLAFVFSIIFHIIHYDLMEILRIFNIQCILLMVFAVYKITKQLAKTYKVNIVLMLVLFLTFFTIPMLTTFLYGDIPSLAFCLLAVYFMMKYTETKKLRYPILATIFTMFAYMMRMNSLIFIIATVIYLLFSFFKGCTKRKGKENALQIAVIVCYVVLSILPTTLVQNYYAKAYNLDESKRYPMTSYLLMAMEEGPRANGWYSEEIASKAITDPEAAKAEYPQKIRERLSYFASNPGYAFQFYTGKIASTWTENTYSAIMNNTLDDNAPINKVKEPLTFYQKVLLLLTCLCCIVILIQNRKNLSLEVIFLVTIFIGGFLFHLLWEAKSRYILPYIVVLIPIASIAIQKFKRKPQDIEQEAKALE